MVESYQHPESESGPDQPVSLADQPYDKKRVSYANTFTNPWKANAIRALEWLTGKWRLVRLVRRFEAMGVPQGQKFWHQALEVMGIDVTTPPDQVAHIPESGPLIVIANHPHGFVDGMVLAKLIGDVREDYKILTRSILTGVAEIDPFMIPVPFPHEEDAQRKNIEMRKAAMAHLAAGGVLILFPAGVVSTSKTWFGPPIEAEWNPFTAKLIRKSEARVLPVYFPGTNSRWYHIADKISATLRQGLLIYEVAHALNKPQRPVVGAPIEREEIEERAGKPRDFVAWLRERTLSLKG